MRIEQSPENFLLPLCTEHPLVAYAQDFSSFTPPNTLLLRMQLMGNIKVVREYIHSCARFGPLDSLQFPLLQNGRSVGCLTF